MGEPLVSAIIPTHDRPAALGRALRSVDSQEYSDIEVLVIETPPDRGDAINECLEELVSYPLTHVLTAPGVGAAAARNIGMERASGDYIAFLDDDDEWMEPKTSIQVDRLESAQEDVAAVVTGDLKISDDGSIRGEYLPPEIDDLVSYQLCWNLGTFSMLMIRADILETIGFLDEDLERREDQDFLLRIARQYDIAAIREPLVKKHKGRNQLSNDYEAGVRANELFREKYASLANELGVRAEMEASLAFMLGRTALEIGAYANARRQFLRAIKHKPSDTGYYRYFLAALGGPLTHRIGIELTRRGILQ